MKTVLLPVLFMVSILHISTPSTAQEQSKQLFSNCMAVAQNLFRILPASTAVTFAKQNDDYTVDITYIGHSSFRIKTPDNINIVTDFTGEAGSGPLPNVVTMNHAHTTHYTRFPDPKIPHALRGWGDGKLPAKHFLEVGDTLIRNVTTDINSRFSGYEPDGNSIFIFETAGLCIGHLGHLHHLPTQVQYGEIGRIDILMVPVDGGYTMGLDNMIKVVKRMRASVILPMHWFSGYSLARFITKMEASFPIKQIGEDTLSLSLRTLPSEPTIMVLTPQTSLGQSFE